MPFLGPIFKIYFIFVTYVYMCVAYIYVHIHGLSAEAREDIGSHGTGPTGWCDRMMWILGMRILSLCKSGKHA